MLGIFAIHVIVGKFWKFDEKKVGKHLGSFWKAANPNIVIKWEPGSSQGEAEVYADLLPPLVLWHDLRETCASFILPYFLEAGVTLSEGHNKWEEGQYCMGPAETQHWGTIQSEASAREGRGDGEGRGDVLTYTSFSIRLSFHSIVSHEKVMTWLP